MHILLLALVALGLLAALLGMLSRKTENNEPEVVQADTASCATCNGEDERCEQECMLEAAVKAIEYYDDEELDQYRGRPSDGYTDSEAEEFADVLYTMKPEEVKGWNRSLILRQINLPNQLKDEVIMMIKG
jgi:hypothetical protein